MAWIQGSTKEFSIDLASLGSIDGVEIYLYNNVSKKQVLKFKYPGTTGFEPIVKVGTVYSWEVTDEQSDNLPTGIYGYELIWIIGNKRYKAQEEYTQITLKSNA